MAKQRISYVPLEKMDEKMRKEMERCQREGTPRPESSAIRAHVPAAFWFFADSWNNLFRNGITKTSLPIGTEIKIFGYQTRSGEPKSVGVFVEYLDGRKVFMGGSAPGADGK